MEVPKSTHCVKITKAKYKLGVQIARKVVQNYCTKIRKENILIKAEIHQNKKYKWQQGLPPHATEITKKRFHSTRYVSRSCK